MPPLQAPNTELTLIQSRVHYAVMLAPTVYLLFLLVPYAVLVIMFSRFVGGIAGAKANQLSTAIQYMYFVPIAVPCLMLWFVWTLERIGAYLQSNVTVTSHRIIYRSGFLFRYTAEIPLSQIEFLSLLEPLLGRILGYGTVTLRGGGGTTFNLPHIQNAVSFHAAVQRAMQRAAGLTPAAPIRSQGAPSSTPHRPRSVIPKPLEVVRPPPPPANHWPKSSPATTRSKPEAPKPTPPDHDDSRFWPKEKS